MSTNDNGKPPSIDTAKTTRLSIRRETIKALSVRSELRTGLRDDCTNNSEKFTCRMVVSSRPTSVAFG